jgi:hypothetical protein
MMFIAQVQFLEPNISKEEIDRRIENEFSKWFRDYVSS